MAKIIERLQRGAADPTVHLIFQVWMSRGAVARPSQLLSEEGRIWEIKGIGADELMRWSQLRDKPVHNRLVERVGVVIEGRLDIAAPAEPAFDFYSWLSDDSREQDLEPLRYTALAIADLVRLLVAEPIAMVLASTRLKLRITEYEVWVPFDFLPQFVHRDWSLDNPALVNLSELTALAVNGPTARAVRLPLRRWGAAAQRRFDEDSLLDYWIAIEALLKERDERWGIRETLANRAANLDGADDSERSRLTQELQTSYGVRSDVVHGGQYSQEGIADALATAREVSRRSLLKIIRWGRPYDCSQLDSPPATPVE